MKRYERLRTVASVLVMACITTWSSACKGDGGRGVGRSGGAGSSTRWLRVAKGGTPVAVIEAKAGQPVTLSWTATTSAADELKALWPELSQPDGFHEKMHVGGSGDERGPLAMVHIPPDHRDYLEVVTSKVEGVGYNVDQIGPLAVPSPAATVRRLRVSHDGDLVGRIFFDGAAPRLEMAKPGATPSYLTSPTTILQTYWDQLAAMSSLHVWYSARRGDKWSLVTREARAGDAAFGDVVRIWLLGETRGAGCYFDVEAE